MSDVTDLTVLGNITGVTERPKSLDPNDRSGTEDIGRDDIRLPRLAIAQGLSPQMTPGDGQYIPDLKLFDMFNDLTGEIYGKGPLTFVPVRRDIRRMQFKPRKDGGGLIDADVPIGDHRLLWTKDDQGNSVPPVATTFVEFVILLIRTGKKPEPIVLSIQQTNKWNTRASDRLQTFIKMRESTIYAGLYTVDTLTPAKNDKGTFGVPVCQNAGYIPKDTPAGNALFEYAKRWHEELKDKHYDINRSPDDDVKEAEEVPF